MFQVMRGRRRWLVPAALALVVPALLLAWTLTAVMAAEPSPSSGAPLPGDPAKGAQLYNANGCTACHGSNLEGGVGPKLNPIVKLPGVADPKEPNFLTTTIKNGRSGDPGYAQAMPAFGKLSDQELKDLAAFIIDSNNKGPAGLGPVELARSNVFWVSVAVLAMVFITYLLARYNMRWIARRAQERQEGERAV